MLQLIGLGLETGDISAKGMEALKKADKVYLEKYTLPIDGSYLSYLEKESGKKIIEVKRKDLEDEAKKTVQEAEESDLAILVSGDPLIATTHHFLLKTAAEIGIEVRVYHAPSIFSVAIGESGLDIYKFGPTTTIPFWSAKYKPTSFLDAIKRNLDNNQHTLVLLDVDSQANKTMAPYDAVSLLIKAEEKKRYGIIKESRRLVIICEAGSEGQEIFYTTVGNAERAKIRSGLEGKRSALIITAETSFAEEELLSRFTF